MAVVLSAWASWALLSAAAFRTRSIHPVLPDPATVEGTDAEKLAAFERTVSQLRDHLTTFVPQALAARSNAPAN
jgi:hypothetical protein